MSLLPQGPPVPSRFPGSRLVSVIIPTFDRPQLLDAALESVAAQDAAGSAEVVVVNDGGISVAGVVRGWEKVLPVKLVELGRRSGPARARNAGIEHADGKYIAFLDDDDVFLPGHLAAGCEPLERGDADFVYLGAVVADRRVNYRPLDPAAFALKAYAFDHRVMMVVNFMHTGSVIVRNFRDSPVRFDEALDVCEDWDLWLALMNTLQYRVLFIDKITSVYHQVVPGTPCLVANARLVSPSPFLLARNYIQNKWPSDDPLVLAHRDWMVSLEQLCSDFIASTGSMPKLLFDDALQYLHRRMSRQQTPDPEDISLFLVPLVRIGN
jgi:glycosyltransferase involved in cell wall biosynthesis